MKIKIWENIFTTMSLRSLLILINLTFKYFILKYVNIFKTHTLREPLFSQFPRFAVIKIMYGCCCCLLAKSCLTLLRLNGLQPTRLPCSWDYWSGLPFPSPGDLPHPGTEHIFPALAGEFFTIEPPGKPMHGYWIHLKHTQTNEFQCNRELKHSPIGFQIITTTNI